MADEFVTSILEAVPSGVAVFSKSYCPFCSKVKSALLKAGIVPVVIELDERDNGAAVQAALLARSGQRTVPNVFLAGKHIGGCDDTIKALSEGVFAKVDTQEAIKEAEEAGLKKCEGNDGIPCLCYHAFN